MENKIITLTIEEDGTQTFLKIDAADIFLEQGEVVTRRASHVEPAGFWLRLAFTVIRMLVNDTSRTAQWTRGWHTLWRVNTSPVGGPVLRWKDVCPGMEYIPEDIAYWPNRQWAIDAEVKFLNQFFAERTIQ